MNLTYEEKDKYIYIKANQKKNFSLRKSIYYRTYLKNDNNFLEAYPIKPFQNIIPKDINLQKIFMAQKSSSLKLNKRFAFLSDKDNNNSNNYKRKKILFTIKEFILKNHIDYKIYYKIIILYDILLIENNSKKLLSNEEIALGALALSVKFNYIENKMLSMKKFLDLYVDKIYTLKHLIEIERICLYLSKYYLNYNTPMCFLEFFLINGIIFNTDSLNKDNYNKIYNKVEKVLEKIMEESNNYLKYNFFHLACSIVSYVREIFDMKKWPFPLKKIFGIEYINFEKEYNSLFNKSTKYTKTDNKKEIIIKGNNNTILLNFENKDNSKKKLTKSNTSKFHLYQKNSDDINNKYCNNIINININNYSIDNNYNDKINNYSYKPRLKSVKDLGRFSSMLHKYKFNSSNKDEIVEQKDISEDKKYNIKIINSHLFRNIGNNFNFKEKSKTTFCSPDKKNKIKNFLRNKDVLDELEEENSKNSSNNEINDEIAKTSTKRDDNKNYNFSSRFQLKTYKSTSNLNSFINTKNKITFQNSKLLELKSSMNEYDHIKVKLKKNEETPKKTSLIQSNKLVKKFHIRNYYIKNKNKLNSENKTDKKIFPVKTEINKNAFETPNKPKGISKISFNNNIEREKKENKTKYKIRYNNLIKYKLSISSSSYKTKGFQ